MLKQIAWNTFKNTGNINTMMEIIEVDKTIKNRNDEINKNQRLEINSFRELSENPIKYKSNI